MSTPQPAAVRRRRARLIPPPGGFTNNKPSHNLGPKDTRTAEQRAHSRAAYDLWLRDLERIRRPAPLKTVNDTTSRVTDIDIEPHSTMAPPGTSLGPTVEIDDDDDDVMAAANPGVSGTAGNPIEIDDRGATPGRNGTATNPITIDDAPSRQAAARDPAAFYKMNGAPAPELLLKYQQRSGAHQGEIPGPGRLRLNMAQLLQDVGYVRKTPAELAAIVRAQNFADDPPRTFEAALQACWLPDTTSFGGGGRSASSLLPGFPMMEDVVFMRAANFGGIPSNCFWKAVAYQVYGDHSYDVRVKAEHLEYFTDVLRWAQHPKRKSFLGC